MKLAKLMIILLVVIIFAANTTTLVEDLPASWLANFGPTIVSGTKGVGLVTSWGVYKAEKIEGKGYVIHIDMSQLPSD